MTDPLDAPRQLVAERKRIHADLLKKYPARTRTDDQTFAIEHALFLYESAKFWLKMAEYTERDRKGWIKYRNRHKENNRAST